MNAPFRRPDDGLSVEDEGFLRELFGVESPGRAAEQERRLERLITHPERSVKVQERLERLLRQGGSPEQQQRLEVGLIRAGKLEDITPFALMTPGRLKIVYRGLWINMSGRKEGSVIVGGRSPRAARRLAEAVDWLDIDATCSFNVLTYGRVAPRDPEDVKAHFGRYRKRLGAELARRGIGVQAVHGREKVGRVPGFWKVDQHAGDGARAHLRRDEHGRPWPRPFHLHELRFGPSEELREPVTTAWNNSMLPYWSRMSGEPLADAVQAVEAGQGAGYYMAGELHGKSDQNPTDWQGRCWGYRDKDLLPTLTAIPVGISMETAGKLERILTEGDRYLLLQGADPVELLEAVGAAVPDVAAAEYEARRPKAARPIELRTAMTKVMRDRDRRETMARRRDSEMKERGVA